MCARLGPLTVVTLAALTACGPGTVSTGDLSPQSAHDDDAATPIANGDADIESPHDDGPPGDSAPADDAPADIDMGGDGSRVVDPGFAIDGRAEIGPDYDDDRLEIRNVPHGKLYHFTMDSDDSTLFPGLNGHYSRQVDVYVPAQYVDGHDVPFIVVQDGPGYTDRVRRALDNLIADGDVPAQIAIMVNNGGGDSIGSERGLEYDTMSDRYVRFVDTEVLPAVREAVKADYPNLKLTDDPEGRAAMGCSSGAAAAFTMAWFGDDRYRRILSYSGTYVDQQDPAVPTFPHGAWEYHEHLIADAARRPLRVYLEIGENDLRANDPESTLHNWVMANQRMADVLEERGYHFRYDFARGAGHCDGGAIGQTLAGALEWLWAGYPID